MIADLNLPMSMTVVVLQMKSVFGALKTAMKAVREGVRTAVANAAAAERERSLKRQQDAKKSNSGQRRGKTLRRRRSAPTVGALQQYSGGEGQALYGAAGAPHSASTSPRASAKRSDASEAREPPAPEIFIGDILFWVLEMETPTRRNDQDQNSPNPPKSADTSPEQ